MVVKALFFDWVDTLAKVVPDWQEMWLGILSDYGIEVSVKNMIAGIRAAEIQIPQGRPMKYREDGEQEPFKRYMEIALTKAGVRIPEQDDLITMVKRIQKAFTEDSRYELFSDVIPMLKQLKEQGYILGVISNMYKGLDDICRQLRIAPYLDVILTSGEAGADKPDPVIFLEAVRRAGADSSQSIYLGDQYEIDIIGARKAGLATVLVDRYNRYPNFIECPVIQELHQLDALI